MKIVFYFFVSLNVAFFLWQTQANSHVKDARPYKSSGAPTLVLLSEAKSSAKKPKNGQTANKTEAMRSSSTQPPKPKKVLAACFSMGPFDGLEQTKPVAETLEGYGALTYTQKKKQRISSGYWVYLPAFDDWKEARAQVMKLEQKGMTDVFIMGRGKMKNAVSLGLFSNKNAADSRMGELKKMGVKPKVEIQYMTNDQYWIDIDVERGKKDVVANINSIADSLTLLQLKKRECN